MTSQNCLEAAMFAASENYSAARYDFYDCGAEFTEVEEVLVPQTEGMPRLEART
jgi:hypothetical protein